MKAHFFFAPVSALLLAALPLAAADNQVMGKVDVSTWRGFNLLEKFTLRQDARFVENDFKWIAELGFNFVRLPSDYRCYTEPGDWLKFKEDQLKHFDEAIALGEKYKLHVSLNLHRAPGFCINPPEEPTNLWKDEKALEAFIAHWVMFAERYKTIAPERLSFNLLNEPTRTSREDFLKVFCRTIEAIQKVDSKRLIIVDGLDVGKTPLPEFLKYDNVIQATRGYHPGTISHYKANWVKGSDQYPEPVWPPARVNGMLFGTSKPEFQSPLVLRGAFKAGTEFALKLNQLSVKAKLVARADGRDVAEKMFDPKANPADWKTVPSGQPWVYHEPAQPMSFTFALKADAKEVAVENADGDWLKFTELAIQPPGGARKAFAANLDWGRKQTPQEVSADLRLLPPPGVSPDQTLADYLKPWKEIAAQGEAVFVGEWGCFNKTPHPVALAWMKAWLEQWKQARMGWAVWNFRGSFGILDSGRADVKYEDWNGHKLDREMLNLLQGYLK